MPAERAPMRKIREVLRLRHACGLSERRIALAVGLSRSTVKSYVERAAATGIAWPVPGEIDDAALERRLFPPVDAASDAARPLPDWSEVQKELKRRGVTLQLLWEEYRAGRTDAYCYSHFCDLHRQWLKTVSPTMRQTHVAGEKLFVDWAGATVPVFDAMTGEERRAHIFVAVLGASNYTYSEGRWSEALPEWIGVHVNAFATIGGVPGAVVCDNLKAGVTAACRYEPGINRTYEEMAAHYGTVILPTRPRKPRDKAKVEVGVLIVERYVLARLRKRRFFSLAELNVAIREIVADLNARLMRKLGVSRAELLETIERPALKGLPTTPYQYAEWKKCRVAPDYHVEVDQHYYSVPSRLIREVVEARLTDTTVEIFHRGSRIASHARSHVRNRHTTINEHMPSAHRRYAEWTPARMMRQAVSIGPATVALVEAIMKAKPHPEPDIAALAFEERLALLVDREATERDNKRLVRRLRFASLRQNAVVEDIDTKAPRGLDRALFQKLAAGEWIERHNNLLIIGPTGVGKSWIACALGHKACRDNRSVLYHRVPRLFDALALARGDGRHERLLKSLARVELLILDDWGLSPLTAEQRRDLLEIMEDRHGRGSTLVTSQLPVEHWHEIIGDPTIADAVLDRLVHNAHRLSLKGESLRKAAARRHKLDAEPVK